MDDRAKYLEDITVLEAQVALLGQADKESSYLIDVFRKILERIENANNSFRDHPQETSSWAVAQFFQKYICTWAEKEFESDHLKCQVSNAIVTMESFSPVYSMFIKGGGRKALGAKFEMDGFDSIINLKDYKIIDLGE